MAFCSNCGHRLMDGSRFCSECGRPVEHIPESTRKIQYEGEIHKCPNCGEVIDSFKTSCPSCGYEIRGPRTSSRIEEFSHKLENCTSISEKRSLIQDFYVPNTKEDIYEFFILASSCVHSDDGTSRAWDAKMKQAYEKAKVSFGNTSEIQYIDQLYKSARKGRFFRAVKESKLVLTLLLVAVGLVLIIVGVIGTSLANDSDSPFWFFTIMGMMLMIYGPFAVLISLIVSAVKRKRNK